MSIRSVIIALVLFFPHTWAATDGGAIPFCAPGKTKDCTPIETIGVTGYWERHATKKYFGMNDVISEISLDWIHESLFESLHTDDKSDVPKCGTTPNPVVIATGNKVLHEVDFSLGGAFPIVVKKTYNHFLETPITYEWQQALTDKGVFGEKWRSTLDFQLLYDNRTPDNSPNKNGIIKILKQTGEFDTFIPSGTDYLWYQIRKGETSQVSYDTSTKRFTHTTLNAGEDIYASNGQTLSRTDKLGNKQTFTYSSGDFGELVSVSHSNGSSITLEWTNQLLTKITDAVGNVYHYEYNSDKLLSKQIHPSGHTKEFFYNDVNHPYALTQTKVNGVVYGTFEYGAATGKVSSSALGINADKEVYSFSYTNTQTWLTYPLGQREVYTYDVNGEERTLKQIDRDGTSYYGSVCRESQARYTYDTNGFVDKTTDWENNVTDYDYDDQGRVVSITKAYGTTDAHQTTFEWDSAFPMLQKRVETSYSKLDKTYDSKGRVLSLTVTDKTKNKTRTTTTRYTEHPNGFIKTMTIDGPRTDVVDETVYHYHDNGMLSKVVNALGHETTMVMYDENARLIEKRAPNGARTVYFYEDNFLESIKHPDNTYSRFTYTALGQLDKETFPYGGFIDREFDSAFALKSLTDSTGANKQFTLNDNLQVTQADIYQSGQLEHRAQQDYDSLGRLKETFGNNGQVVTYQYNSDSTIESVTDALNNKTSFTYNALGQLATKTDAENALTTYQYNSMGLLWKVTDGNGNTTTYNYNGFGDLTSLNSQDTGTTLFLYDEGNLTDRLDANANEFIYTYDALNRIKTRTSGVDVITNRYDENGDIGYLTSMTDLSGSSTYDYSTAGELLSYTQVVDGQSSTISYEYYRSGNDIVVINYPSGNSIGYYYDANGQITRVNAVIGGVTKTVVNNIEYKPFGGVTHWDFGNGLQRTLEYDLDYRLTGIETSAGIQNLDFGYDETNLLGQIDNHHNFDFSLLLGYDKVGQLTSSSAPSGDEGFFYDDVGNREEYRANGETLYLGIAPTSNRLTSLGKKFEEVDIDYDDNGNLTQTITMAMTYSGGNRVIDFTVPIIEEYFGYNEFNQFSSHTKQGLTTTYRYNGLGHRVSKQNSQMSSLFVYDLSGTLLSEKTGADVKDYIYLHGAPIGYIKNGQLYFVHTDQVSRPELITNTSGAIVWQANLKPFNRTVKSTSIGEFNLGFPGQYYDSESGLWYNINRYYDPETGRYTQSDPIGLAGGMNTYAYVGGNPISYIDPLGLDAEVTIWEPVGYGRSSFGHVSTSINGTTYSYGPSGMTIMPTSEYRAANSFRGGVTSIVSLTPKQTSELEAHLKKGSASYGALGNNCAAPIQRGLLQQGIDTGDVILPVSLGNALIDAGVVSGFIFHSPAPQSGGTP